MNYELRMTFLSFFIYHLSFRPKAARPLGRLSAMYMPAKISMVPMMSQMVMRSFSTSQAQTMVTTGLKYTKLVVTITPKRRTTQFHARKHAVEAMHPRKRRWKMDMGLKMASIGGRSGQAM